MNTVKRGVPLEFGILQTATAFAPLVFAENPKDFQVFPAS